MAGKPTRRINDKRAGIGAGIDMYGGPVIDPTKNVLDTLDAATSRLDDLRTVHVLRLQDAIAHVREMQMIQAQHQTEIGNLRAEHLKEMNAAATAALAASAAQAQTAIQALAQTSAVTATRVDERLGSVEKSLNIGAGKGEGFSSTGAIIFAVVMGVAAFGSLIFAVLKH
jgi:hypothetical protein